LRGGRAGHGFFVDEGRLTRKMRAMKSKRIALKHCGGCDPGFDRVEYFKRIRDAAGDSIEWVTLDDEGFDAVLVISACEAACPEEKIDFSPYGRVVAVRDDKIDPDEIVKLLTR